MTCINTFVADPILHLVMVVGSLGEVGTQGRRAGK